MLKRDLTKLNPKRDFFKLAEVAELLKVPRFNLDKMLFRGVLPYHVPPGKKAKYYRLDEVRRVLDAVQEFKEAGTAMRSWRGLLLKKTWYVALLENSGVSAKM